MRKRAFGGPIQKDEFANMILPIRTNIRPYRTPYTNYALIVVNVVIFLLTYSPHYVPIGGQLAVEPLRVWAETFMLVPQHPRLWQFISYAFLHGGYMHIIGNMFFLYLFGNNVNDKLGNLGYLCFYLAGAVFSGIGHTLINTSSVLGASGAVAAVTGAYLVLFPQTSITIVYWLFFFIGTAEWPALYFIGLKMILLDNMIVRYTPNVAYDAHLSGYAFGILTMLALLGTKLIAGSSFDLWSMIRQWNRRRRYRDAVSGGLHPFTGRTGSKYVKAKEIKKTPHHKRGRPATPAQQARDKEILRLRSEIGSRISAGNLANAADLYLELEKIDSEQVLPRQQLLDIANQLMTAGKWTESAGSYEKFLSYYGNYEYAEQVKLMLGILYSRYLHQNEAAIKYLQAAYDKLTDPGQKKMCKAELDRLKE